MSINQRVYYLVYLLFYVSLFAPLDKGANGSFSFIFRLWGYEELGKQPLAVFASFCVQKEGSIHCRLKDDPGFITHQRDVFGTMRVGFEERL